MKIYSLIWKGIFIWICWFFFYIPCLSQSGKGEFKLVSYSVPVRPDAKHGNRHDQKVIFDLVRQRDGLEVWANQVSDLPRSVRKIKFYRLKGTANFINPPAYRKAGKSGMNEIRNNVHSQFKNLMPGILSMYSEGKNARDTANFKKQLQYNFNNMIRGKKGSNLYNDQWFLLARLPISENDPGNYRARIHVRGAMDQYLYCDTIPAAAYSTLPEVDRVPCKPIDRFFDFQKLNGWGLRNVRPMRYIPSRREIIHKEFSIYFSRDSSSVRSELLQPVIDFLENNPYSIINASVEGYASVEGTEENNIRLQHRRAELMISILQQHNPDEITLDTVIAEENWEMFFKQVKGTGFEYMDSLSKDSLRVLLRDSTLLVKLEPILRPERKAVLNLTLARVFNQAEINDNLLDDIRSLSGYIITHRDTYSENNLRKVAGILHTAEERVDEKLLDKDKVSYTLGSLDDPLFWVMYFYTALSKYESTGRQPAIFTWQEILQRAQDGIIILIRRTENSGVHSTFFRMAVDIQYYAFRFMIDKIAPWELLCDIDYPDESDFYPLILNRYAFTFNYASGHIHEIPCNPDLEVRARGHYISPDTAWYITPSLPLSLDSLLADRYVNLNRRTPVIYDQSPKGPYYYFLKKSFVTGDESIKKYVIQSDHLYEFDLMNLIWRNVENWDPIHNSFYDEDIDMVEMARLIDRLKTIDKRICPMQKYQLYLDFCLKSLYYFRLHGNPYDRDETDVAEQSLRYIGDYYISRISRLPDNIVMTVVRQLNFFYGLPGRQVSTFWSYRLLRESRKNSFHSVIENRLYWQLASFYEKNFPSAVARNHGPGPDFCLFAGNAFRLKPWRADVREVYHQACGP